VLVPSDIKRAAAFIKWISAAPGDRLDLPAHEFSAALASALTLRNKAGALLLELIITTA
jgi:hypothetical protein